VGHGAGLYLYGDMRAALPERLVCLAGGAGLFCLRYRALLLAL